MQIIRSSHGGRITVNRGSWGSDNIYGRVTDGMGSPVKGAEVEVKNKTKNEQNKGKTDDTGSFDLDVDAAAGNRIYVHARWKDHQRSWKSVSGEVTLSTDKRESFGAVSSEYRQTTKWWACSERWKSVKFSNGVHFPDMPRQVEEVQRKLEYLLPPLMEFDMPGYYKSLTNPWKGYEPSEFKDNPLQIVRIQGIEKYLDHTMHRHQSNQKNEFANRQAFSEAISIITIVEILGESLIVSFFAKGLTLLGRCLVTKVAGTRMAAGAQQLASRFSRVATSRFAQRLGLAKLGGVSKRFVEPLIGAVIFDEWEDLIFELAGKAISPEYHLTTAKLAGLVVLAVKLARAPNKIAQRTSTMEDSRNATLSPSGDKEFIRMVLAAKLQTEMQVCQAAQAAADAFWEHAHTEVKQVRWWAAEVGNKARIETSTGWAAWAMTIRDELKTCSGQALESHVLAEYWRKASDVLFEIYGAAAAACVRIRQVTPEQVAKEGK